MRSCRSTLLSAAFATALSAPVLVLASACAAHPEAGQGVPLSPAQMEALWQEAQPFPDFLEGVVARRAEWEENYLVAVAHRESRARAEAVPGTWRLLAVAEDGCSDSASTLPHVARLAEALPGLELRVIDSARGRTLMERFRTPDGRAATPTLLLLDEQFETTGCWIERPVELQRWYIEQRPSLSSDALYEGKMAWFSDDRGVSTLSEIVALLEGASRGTPVCPTP